MQKTQTDATHHASRRKTAGWPAASAGFKTHRGTAAERLVMQLATDSLNAYGLGRARRTGLRQKAVGERNAGILRTLAQMQQMQQQPDMMQAVLIWDSTMAPLTTNAAQLAEIGVECLHGRTIEEVREIVTLLPQDNVRPALVTLIEGLADLGVFLLHTDHLTDRELLAVILTDVIRQEVRDLPPSPGVHEFIDIANCTGKAGKHGVTKCVRDCYLPQPSKVLA
jgi:hypothetical protein